MTSILDICALSDCIFLHLSLTYSNNLIRNHNHFLIQLSLFIKYLEEGITMTIMAIILLVLIVLFIGWGISIYNRLIATRNQVSNQFANIDVILKQRADQIPQLMAIAEKAMEHEKGVFIALSDARQRYFKAQNINEKISATNEMNTALRGMIALAENYPTLISGEQLALLQTGVSDVENKIAQRREGFNDATTNYNTAIEMFPDSLIAGLFRFERMQLLEIPKEEMKFEGIHFK